MKKYGSGLVLSWAAMCVAGFAAPARGADDARLDDVVVTASGTEQTVRDAPASISVITRDDLEKKPIQELAEMLGTVPGVTLNRAGNQVPGVQMRGLNAAYTLILIDGKRVNATSAMFRGNDYDSGWVPSDEIERIEVVRGPMSSLYGSDAIGGVVNIITRKIGKRWHGSIRQDVVLSEDAATGDTYAGTLSASGPLIADVLGLRVYAGYDKRDAGDATANSTGLDSMPKISNRYASTRLSWTPGNRHDVIADYDYSYRDHAGFPMRRNALSLKHSGRYDFGSSEINLYADEIRNKVGTVSGQTNPNKSNTETLDGKLSVPWEAARQLLTGGGEIRRERLYDPTNLAGLPGTPGYGEDPTTTVRQYALFLEDEFTLLESLKLTLGDRYDRHENFGGNHSPRAYLVYHLNDAVSFKGGWARAFRAPTLLQNSPSWGSPSCGSLTNGCYIIGSQDLKPETATSKELGVQADFGRWGGGVTLFRTDLSNMIDITSRTASAALAPSYSNFVGFLPDGRPIFAYQNINKVRTEGAEVGFNATLAAPWRLRANYTYVHARNRSGAIELPLPYRPENVANLTLDWQASAALSLSATARYNGKQFINVPSNGQNMVSKADYTVADLTAAYVIDKTFTLRGGILNVANKTFDRTQSVDFNEEGRRYYLSLAANF
ncbi:MAG: TonB-dependent receptor [Rhodocyclaceae bacterium]